MTDCQICFSQTASAVRCPGGCQYCATCLQQSVRFRAFEGATWDTIRACPICGQALALDDVKAILSESTVRQLEANVRAVDIWKAELRADESYFKCPDCAEYWISAGAQSECPNCGTEVCQRCWRSVGECACEVDVPNVAEAQSAAVIRTCPRCRTPFIKDDDNCNHVKCIKCSADICYYCGCLYAGGDIYSDHFGETDEGKCPMFASQDELHGNRAYRAQEEFEQRMGART